MWQILNVEPVYGVCSLCRSHECGIVDGKHQWIHTEALDDTRENIVIGYKCVKLFAENLGISKEMVEKVVTAPPTDEQIMKVLKECFTIPDSGKWSVDIEPIPSDTLVTRVTANPITKVEESQYKSRPRRNGTSKK